VEKTGNNTSKNDKYVSDRDNQTSADAYISGSYNGAFTYNVCKHVRDVKGRISRGELLKKGEGFPEVQWLQPGAPVGVPQRGAREEYPGVGTLSLLK